MFNDSVWDADRAGARALGKRFEAVAENLSNVNTPGYKRKEVEFEGLLREALEKASKPEAKVSLATTDPAHITSEGLLSEAGEIPVTVKTVEGESFRLDGNNVDPEREMAKLAETRMAYSAMTALMGKRADLLKKAMGGG